MLTSAMFVRTYISYKRKTSCTFSKSFPGSRHSSKLVGYIARQMPAQQLEPPESWERGQGSENARENYEFRSCAFLSFIMENKPAATVQIE